MTHERELKIRLLVHEAAAMLARLRRSVAITGPVSQGLCDLQGALAVLAGLVPVTEAGQEPAPPTPTHAETVNTEQPLCPFAYWQDGRGVKWLAHAETGKILGEVKEDQRSGSWDAYYRRGGRLRRQRRHAEFISMDDAMKAVMRWHREALARREEQA